MDMFKLIEKVTSKNGIKKAQFSIANTKFPLTIENISEWSDIIFKEKIEYYKNALIKNIVDYDDDDFMRSREVFLADLIILIDLYIQEAEREIIKRRWSSSNEKYKEKKAIITGYKKVIALLTGYKIKSE